MRFLVSLQASSPAGFQYRPSGSKQVLLIMDMTRLRAILFLAGTMQLTGISGNVLSHPPLSRRPTNHHFPFLLLGPRLRLASLGLRPLNSEYGDFIDCRIL